MLREGCGSYFSPHAAAATLPRTQTASHPPHLSHTHTDTLPERMHAQRIELSPSSLPHISLPSPPTSPTHSHRHRPATDSAYNQYKTTTKTMQTAFGIRAAIQWVFGQPSETNVEMRKEETDEEVKTRRKVHVNQYVHASHKEPKVRPRPPRPRIYHLAGLQGGLRGGPFSSSPRTTLYQPHLILPLPFSTHPPTLTGGFSTPHRPHSFTYRLEPNLADGAVL